MKYNPISFLSKWFQWTKESQELFREQTKWVLGLIAVAFRAVRRVAGGGAKDTLPPQRLVSECKKRGEWGWIKALPYGYSAPGQCSSPAKLQLRAMGRSHRRFLRRMAWPNQHSGSWIHQVSIHICWINERFMLRPRQRREFGHFWIGISVKLCGKRIRKRRSVNTISRASGSLLLFVCLF